MKNERLNIHAPMLLLKRKALNILRVHSAFCVCFVAFCAYFVVCLACLFSVCFAACLAACCVAYFSAVFIAVLLLILLLFLFLFLLKSLLESKPPAFFGRISHKAKKALKRVEMRSESFAADRNVMKYTDMEDTKEKRKGKKKQRE